MANRKLSRDQKRKKKLRERKSQEPIQPYKGDKYKSEKYVEALMRAEMGIYESYVISERRLTDRDVIRSLQALVLELQHRNEGAAAVSPEADRQEPQDLIAIRIKQNWEDLFADRPRLPNSDLTGILRTIMHSIRIRSQMAGSSRGYLNFLGGFLQEAGVDVHEVSPGDELGLVEEGSYDEDDRSDEQILTELGEAWIASGDPMAKKEFLSEAEALIEDGLEDVVLDVSRRLLGTTNQASLVQEIQLLVQAASRQESPSTKRAE